MTDDTLDPNDILILVRPTLSKTTDKIEKAFQDIRGEQTETHTGFDFGIDDFSWM